jgi:hypothetical protein
MFNLRDKPEKPCKLCLRAAWVRWVGEKGEELILQILPTALQRLSSPKAHLQNICLQNFQIAQSTVYLSIKGRFASMKFAVHTE